MTKTTLDREHGQTLVIFGLLLAALCGFVALTIDVGIILVERSHLQNSADAAALAGASALGDSPEAAVAKAQEYAEKNGIDPTDSSFAFEATAPYNGDSAKIEVKVSHEVGFTFGRLLGLDFTNVPARAVAEQPFYSNVVDEYALFVMNGGCQPIDPLNVSGSLNDIVGATHSNSTIQISGSDNSFQGPLTHTCGFDDSGSGNTYSPAPQKNPRVLVMDYAWDTFCYAGNPDLVIPIQTEDIDLNSIPEAWIDDDPDTLQLKDGIFCSTGDVVLGDQGVTGNVTFVAGDEIKISGSDFDITGFYEDVLLFSSASHDNAIDMSGSGGNWSGFIIAPDGRVKVQGSDNLSVNGSILADRITVSGSDFSIDATGYESAASWTDALRLDE